MHWTFNPYRFLAWRIKEMDKENEQVEKTWGYEIWFANTKDYCGKLIVVNPDFWSSMGNFHYHKIKDETFFVIEGSLWLDIADGKGEYQRMTLYENHSYRVMPGVKHRFASARSIPCKFIEASTHHDDEDSYRCYFDKKKGEWENV